MWQDKINSTKVQLRICPDWAWRALAEQQPAEKIKAELSNWLESSSGRKPSEAALQFMYELYAEEYANQNS
jgi:hypothetical protein